MGTSLDSIAISLKNFSLEMKDNTTNDVKENIRGIYKQLNEIKANLDDYFSSTKEDKNDLILPTYSEDWEVNIGDIVATSCFYDEKNQVIKFSDGTNDKELQQQAKEAGYFPVAIGVVCEEEGDIIINYMLLDRNSKVKLVNIFWCVEEKVTNWFKCDVKKIGVDLEKIREYLNLNIRSHSIKKDRLTALKAVTKSLER